MIYKKPVASKLRLFCTRSDQILRRMLLQQSQPPLTSHGERRSRPAGGASEGDSDRCGCRSEVATEKESQLARYRSDSVKLFFRNHLKCHRKRLRAPNEIFRAMPGQEMKKYGSLFFFRFPASGCTQLRFSAQTAPAVISKWP